MNSVEESREHSSQIESEGGEPLLQRRRLLGMAWIVAGVFFVCSIVVLPLLSRYRGDERAYTNAAIQMVQRGDYLTPFFSDGSPRFNKPVLNYWLIAWSYKALGINEFASRIAQLLAGTLSLLAAYRLCRVLFEDSRVALVAVAFLAANEQVLNTSVRATTDVVQYFFLTVALAGFAAVVFRGSRSWTDYLLAFGGLGMAMLTKGGMSILVLVFTAGFGIYHARRTHQGVGKQLKAIVPWWGVALMLLPTVAWLALNYLKYGPHAIGGLWSDQIGNRLDSGPDYFWQNVLAYASAPVVEFLPWVIALAAVAAAGRKELGALVSRRRLELLFCGCFFLAYFLILIFGNITRTRYVLPTYPLLAGGAAYLLVGLCDRSIGAAKMTRLLGWPRRRSSGLCLPWAGRDHDSPARLH